MVIATLSVIINSTMIRLQAHRREERKWFIINWAISIVFIIIAMVLFFGMLGMLGKRVDPAFYNCLATIGVALISLIGGIFIGEKIKK